MCLGPSGTGCSVDNVAAVLSQDARPSEAAVVDLLFGPVNLDWECRLLIWFEALFRVEGSGLKNQIFSFS